MPHKENKLPAANSLIATTQAHLRLRADPQPMQRGSTYVPVAAPTEANLCDWIASACAGNAIQYHEGLLLRDRSEVASAFSVKERNRIHAVARRAWIACELGLVHLFSQKVEDDRYRYLAIRTGNPLKPPDIRARLRTAQPVPAPRKPN